MRQIYEIKMKISALNKIVPHRQRQAMCSTFQQQDISASLNLHGIKSAGQECCY